MTHSMTLILHRRLFAIGAVLGAVVLLAGCVEPWRVVEVRQPMTAHPVVAAIPPSMNGAIYQPTSYQPLFEDRRARRIGDTLTININEKLIASKQASSTASRTGSTTFAVPEIKGIPGKTLQGASLKANSANEFEGKGDSGANNTFTGTITVTVTEILANGNLVVSGEKQIGINQGSEFIRVSGVINPIHILPGNVVSSTQVADARLEYRGTGYIDEAQTMGWLARTFQSVLPF